MSPAHAPAARPRSRRRRCCRGRTARRSSAPRPARAERVQRRVARARHQLVARNAELLDRAASRARTCCGGVDGPAGSGCMARDYTGRVTTPRRHRNRSEHRPRRARRAVKAWGRELGFQQVGIAASTCPTTSGGCCDWLDAGRHGEMDYMARHGTRRARPAELVPGTLRVISARMDYWPGDARMPRRVLGDRAAGLRVALRARPRLSQGAAQRARALADRLAAARRRRAAIARSSTARRCSRRRSRATPASAGSASTPT